MNLEDIADELYVLTPAEFTSARNERSKAARAAGDKALAGQIRALRKPTVAAWLANQVVRQRRALVEELLALGAELRTAMSAPSGPELQRLITRQRDLVQALLTQAKDLATASGNPVTEPVVQGLSDTLLAALSDPQAAEALVMGRLTEALTPPAFGGIYPSTERIEARASLGGSGERTDKDDDDDAAARRDGALREANEAQDRAQAARDAFRLAKASMDSANTATRLATDLVDHLSAELAMASAKRDIAQQAEADARTTLDQANRRLREVEEQLRRALSALGQPHTDSGRA